MFHENMNTLTGIQPKRSFTRPTGLKVTGMIERREKREKSNEAEHSYVFYIADFSFWTRKKLYQMEVTCR